MLRWALYFFIIAIIAGGLGFYGLAATAALIAKTLFYVFIILCIISFIMGLAQTIKK
jgi:uncharacterized membrane protein YtjA (UPF0391 family)